MASGAIIGGYGDDGSASTFRFAPPFAISPLAMAPLSTFATSSVPQRHVRRENKPPLAHVSKATHIHKLAQRATQDVTLHLNHPFPLL